MIARFVVLLAVHQFQQILVGTQIVVRRIGLLHILLAVGNQIAVDLLVGSGFLQIGFELIARFVVLLAAHQFQQILVGTQIVVSRIGLLHILLAVGNQIAVDLLVGSGFLQIDFELIAHFAVLLVVH